MDIIAHGLWAAAGATVARKSANVRIRLGWTVLWAMFPDLLAFGPPVAVGLWLLLTGGADFRSLRAGHLPRVSFGVPLYPLGHSLITFLLVFAVASVLARRFVLELLGWLSHILIDIFTHSYRYYATRFLWPLSDIRFNGLPWWTPWFWCATYVALAIVYFLLWRKGWLTRARNSK
jgi:hypothetical protein